MLTLARRLGLVAALVLYTIWDEALLSAPVVASARWFGVWPTFAAFSLLYGSAGFALSLLVVHAYARRMSGRPGRLELRAQRDAATTRHRWARQLLQRGGWLGFCLASFALGPMVTTWFLYATGRVRSQVRLVALASSAVFAVTFVAPYCGVGGLL
ncbi:MAG: hypothetical protein M3R01_05385 [Actinomycetota bacterium]|nr:hypothetical protein [Actinomycetota bacterium]